MSYFMHSKRMKAIDSIKELVRERKKMSKRELRLEIMKRQNFSGQTADRYIADLLDMGILKSNSDTITLVEG